MVNNVTNTSQNSLSNILKEYSELPEYSGLSIPSANSKSLFGDYPINIACTRGIVNEVLMLLSAGADINAKGEHGYTPLHDAVEQGHLAIVKLLLEKGADQSLPNDDGDKPSELAELLQENEIYQLLIHTR